MILRLHGKDVSGELLGVTCYLHVKISEQPPPTVVDEPERHSLQGRHMNRLRMVQWLFALLAIASFYRMRPSCL